MESASSPNGTFERVYSQEEKAALRGEVFTHRELVGVDFAGADLRGSRFQGTSLVRCNFKDADLRGARFVLCDFTGVVLTDAILGDNRFDGSTFADMIGVEAPTQTLIEKNGGTFLPPHASSR
ncbi:MAG: pentapeptide repeat-containing protein [Labilithrix sp.]|nr:pentapeptide repeat-containing protein [Labilithrix sp.]MCW5816465.1 pentapeptide repeat-containing protein [Labilithrix sp.]